MTAPDPTTEDDLLQPGWRASVRSVDGLDLHVVEAGADDAPLLVLLHGLTLCDDGQLEMIDGVSHWLHREQPERINRHIIDFLGSAIRTEP